MSGRTISEQILASRSGTAARAGDIVVCRFDRALGTDGSVPMAIDYFRAMGGERVATPERILFSFDHYAPPSSAASARFHDEMRAFAEAHGIDARGVGEGISHQLAVELGLAVPGSLIVGADSHTVMCGALNAFGTGIGSSDLAAAMLAGQVWLRVPESARVILEGEAAPGVSAKDIVLALVERLGSEGAAYLALEFEGPGAAALSMDGRLVVSNMVTEVGAKAGIFPCDAVTTAFLAQRTREGFEGVRPEPGARYARELVVDLSRLTPRLALPHAPDRVVPVETAAGTPVHMVFVGTCTGGRASDIREVAEIVERGGGVAAGVQLVVTPASRCVLQELALDGTLARLNALGAVLTTPGCGPCCGTSGPVPGDGMNVLSTANRNYLGRMGNPRAAIYLASPAVRAAGAVAGLIVDPAEAPT